MGSSLAPRPERLEEYLCGGNLATALADERASKRRGRPSYVLGAAGFAA